MSTTRREFLKLAGAIGAAGTCGVNTVHGASGHGAGPESWGMLTDLTQCIGCRKCEFACKQANGLPNQAIEAFEDTSVFNQKRRIDANNVTVVNRYQEQSSDAKPVYVKTQCMHCNEPACASACPVGAIRKTAQGPVVYHPRTCIGCRYCMMACPFSMPAYTYDDPFTPVVRKCSMCFQRVKEGDVPACAKICPVEAITFGTRGQLLTLAREKILKHPDRYVDHIYGENEVGGTGVLYLAPRPFEELGFRTDLGTTPYPEMTARFMSIVPFVVMIWPALLTGVYTLTKRRRVEILKQERDSVHNPPRSCNHEPHIDSGSKGA